MRKPLMQLYGITTSSDSKMRPVRYRYAVARQVRRRPRVWCLAVPLWRCAVDAECGGSAPRPPRRPSPRRQRCRRRRRSTTDPTHRLPRRPSASTAQPVTMTPRPPGVLPDRRLTAYRFQILYTRDTRRIAMSIITYSANAIQRVGYSKPHTGTNFVK